MTEKTEGWLSILILFFLIAAILAVFFSFGYWAAGQDQLRANADLACSEANWTCSSYSSCWGAVKAYNQKHDTNLKAFCATSDGRNGGIVEGKLK